VRSWTVIFLPAVALLASCGHESVVEPQVAVVESMPCAGPSMFACGSWSPCRPNPAAAVFDLDMSAHGSVEAIRQAGGTIVHEFNVPIVRALLPVDAIPGLVSSRQISAAFEVPPESALDFGGFIGIPLPLTSDDREFLASAGVTIKHEFTSIDAVFALIPDAAVPAIRIRPGVRYVEINGVACAEGGVGAAR